MYTNNSGISLSLAVWLANDEYEAYEATNTISVTTIIKSIKQIILGMRVSPVTDPVDVQSMLASKIGVAIHNNIELAWGGEYRFLLKELGYPEQVIKRIRINPTKENLINEPDIVPIYIEQRADKIIAGVNISGKFDFVIEGEVEDFKTTSTYTWVHKTGDKKNALQGSIYRWLNQDKITSDFVSIQYIFKDWKAGMVVQDPKYPKRAVMTDKLPLLSIADTEAYLIKKINEVKSLLEKPESAMNDCTPEDLWQKPAVFKYYKDPTKTTRSTKNFDSQHLASLRLLKDGRVGIVKEIAGKVIACKYCNASSVCKQKDKYILNGTLTM